MSLRQLALMLALATSLPLASDPLRAEPNLPTRTQLADLKAQGLDKRDEELARVLVELVNGAIDAMKANDVDRAQALLTTFREKGRARFAKADLPLWAKELSDKSVQISGQIALGQHGTTTPADSQSNEPKSGRRVSIDQVIEQPDAVDADELPSKKHFKTLQGKGLVAKEKKVARRLHSLLGSAIDAAKAHDTELAQSLLDEFEGIYDKRFSNSPADKVPAWARDLFEDHARVRANVVLQRLDEAKPRGDR